MKWILMAILLVLVQFQAHQTVFNLELQEEDNHRITDALQLASQDAVEEVTQDSVGNGQAVFDQTEADATFRATLAANLNLVPTTLQPKPNTMLTVAPKILGETFIDWSDATFPTTYVNNTYNINMTLNDPSIIFVVQFTMPSYAANVSSFTINVPVVQSYQDDN